MTEVNIGAEIQKMAKTRRMSSSSIAKKLGVTRSNMPHIFRRKAIDTDLLFKLSEILDYNFFDLYAGALRKKMGMERGMSKEADTQATTHALQVHEKNASVQNKYIELLEEKIAALQKESGSSSKKRKK
jgi:hypothetical protein